MVVEKKSSRIVTPEALLDYMFERMGGREEAVRLFHLKEIGEMAQKGKTFNELLDAAIRDGWKEELFGISLPDFIEAASREEAAAPMEDPPPRSREVRDRVLQYVRNNPGARRADVAHSLGIRPSRLSSVLTGLVKEGLLVKDGIRGGSSYRVP